ncbi:MAG: hypothetical protein P8183_09255 [Anaerolineae bacterium]
MKSSFFINQILHLRTALGLQAGHHIGVSLDATAVSNCEIVSSAKVRPASRLLLMSTFTMGCLSQPRPL